MTATHSRSTSTAPNGIDMRPHPPTPRPRARHRLGDPRRPGLVPATALPGLQVLHAEGDQPHSQLDTTLLPAATNRGPTFESDIQHHASADSTVFGPLQVCDRPNSASAHEVHPEPTRQARTWAWIRVWLAGK